MKSRRPLALSALPLSVLVFVIGCQDQNVPTEPVQNACAGVTRCTSVTVANVNPDGSGVRVLKVDGGAGAIAGARFPDNWLPVGGPQNVVVTITEVTSTETDAVSRTRKTPCHAGLPFQQFNKCFKFTTTPELAAINENGDEFARDVTVAICYRLEGTGDPREKFAEMYASGPNEPAHALADVGDDGILGVGARDCTTIEPSGLGSSNPLTRYASMGWRKFREGLGQLFGVKTAYAVDVGLGGIVKKFSNIGPALTAEIQAYPTTATALTLQSGTATARARIVGNHTHGVDAQPTIDGIDSVPVTFIVTAGNGTLRALNSVASVDSLTVNTSMFTITSQEIFDPGVASVIWTPPTAPGTYTLTATGPATGGPVTFTAIVPPAFDTWTRLTAGSFHTCGLTSGGAAYCWGFNANGQLGDGSTTERTTPVAVVAGGLTFASLMAGGEPQHTCGLTSGGAAYCWGFNGNGQLGDGSTTDRTTPVAVAAGGLTFASLTASDTHTCGLTSGGAAYCWGQNLFGELGDSTTTDRTRPVAVQAGGIAFASLMAGGPHTCGLTSGGAAYCWGFNANGQLGDGSTTGRTAPVGVAGFTFASVTAGGFHTCGLTSGGAAYCWGYNLYGQLGDGSTTDRTAPVAVVSGITFASLTAGAYHTCGLTSGGAAYCWGYNFYGQLGDGSTSGRTTPVAVTGGITFASLMAGGTHTCGLTSGGAAYCWGFNGGGQLGDGTTTNRATPTPVANR